jgi:hypothetical protein
MRIRPHVTRAWYHHGYPSFLLKISSGYRPTRKTQLVKTREVTGSNLDLTVGPWLWALWAYKKVKVVAGWGFDLVPRKHDTILATLPSFKNQPQGVGQPIKRCMLRHFLFWKWSPIQIQKGRSTPAWVVPCLPKRKKKVHHFISRSQNYLLKHCQF